ncbi:MAG TPA: hypothetical protein PKJ13_05935, partial [bacterium]|nr:hypothetical protein [bacterium]
MRSHIALIILTIWAASASAAQQLQTLLQQEMEAGAISRGEFLAYQLIAAEDPDRLPLRYQTAGLDLLH